MKKLIFILLINFNMFSSEPKKQRISQEGSVALNPNLSFKDMILQGKVPEVLIHLQSHPEDINYKDEYGATTLMLAIKSDSFPMFMEILNKTKNVNETDVVGSPALFYIPHYAKAQNVILFTKMLAQRNANFNATNQKGENILIKAVQNGRLDLINYLLTLPYFNNPSNINFVTNIGETPLMYVADFISNENDNNNIAKEIITLLLQKGANINQIDDDFDGTLLLRMINKANLDMVKFVLDMGANINLLTKVLIYDDIEDFFTPLTYAIYIRKLFDNQLKDRNDKLLEIIEYLIEKGANTANVPDQITLSPMLLAIDSGDFDVVRLLSKKEFDKSAALQLVNQKFQQELTPKLYEALINIRRYLKNPYDYTETQAAKLIAKEELSKYHLPYDVSDIIGEYITGPTKQNEIVINRVKNNIMEKNYSLIKQLSFNSLQLKNNANETALIAAIKLEDLTAIAIILNKLKDLPKYEMKMLEDKKSAILQKASGVPSREQLKLLNEIETEKRNFTNNFHEQLNEAYELAQLIDNKEVINLLNQYKNAFNI